MVCDGSKSFKIPGKCPILSHRFAGPMIVGENRTMTSETELLNVQGTPDVSSSFFVLIPTLLGKGSHLTSKSIQKKNWHNLKALSRDIKWPVPQADSTTSKEPSCF